ncbi:hypothetical protein COV17_04330 [Candidatus Woesearchaeota archaeon CG10_big_fil_rev_8_21_14_0_10_36_11]|nr:MAG: hypothetical protein COV17_04330 [Candidatus Woesearchaeota archaeon CG10_big_fil_rev_8_21_14_0_10_36_11]
MKDIPKLKRPSRSPEHHSVHKKHLTVLWVGLVILAVAVAVLYPFIKDGVVGRAFGDFPTGFYWEEESVAVENTGYNFESCPSGLDPIRRITKLPTSSAINTADNDYCCVNSGIYCPDLAPGAQASGSNVPIENFRCYSLNSVIKPTATSTSRLCTENTVNNIYGPSMWVNCYDTLNPGIFEEPGSSASGRFLCLEDQWTPCTSEMVGLLEDEEKYYCDGIQWHDCDLGENADEVIADGRFSCAARDLWLECNSQNENELSERRGTFCDGSIWQACNASNIGEPSDMWGYFCDLTDNYIWNNQFDMKEFLEVKLTVGDASTKTIDQQSLYACSEDRQTTPEHFQTCFMKNDDNIEVLGLLVPSLDVLHATNQKPTIWNVDYLLIYDQTTPDRTGVVTLKNLSQEDANFPSSVFAGLADGERIGLVLDDEYYLLSHEGQEFSLQNLQLTHIPTLQQFSLQQLPEYQFQFEVFAGRAITISLQDGRYFISVTEPEEAAAAYVIPHVLTEEYEVGFSKTSPIRLVDDGASIQITVCQSDNENDVFELQVCLNDEPLVTLPQGVLLKYGLGEKEVGFLYQYNATSGKQGYIFDLVSVPAGGTMVDLDNVIFIENMVNSRRVAVEFENSLYLLTHPATSPLSLPSTSLVSYTQAADTTSVIESYPASGNEKKAYISIPDGRMTLERSYNPPESVSVPPPPFKLSGLTNNQIADIEVTMENQLSWSVSSNAPANVVSPAFGILSVSERDINGDVNWFRLDSLKGNVDIPKETPIINNNVLFYYFSSVVHESARIKTANMYQYYNISHLGSNFHDYNDQFIDTFTAGNEIALSFNGAYFLLGYEGPVGGELQFFDYQYLTLRSLTEDIVYTDKVVSYTDGVTFHVPAGDIQVVIDYDLNQIQFSSVTQMGLLESFLPQETYSATLTPLNTVKVGVETYTICDNAYTQTFTESVLLCRGGVYSKTLVRDELVSDYVNGILIQYHGRNDGGQKVVTFRYIFTFNEFTHFSDNKVKTQDWLTVANNLQNNHNPVIFLEDKWYELRGSSTLDSFQLVELPRISSFNEIQMHATGSQYEGTENGTIVINKRMLFFQKEFVEIDGNFKINLVMTPLPQYLLNAVGFNVSATQTFQMFQTELNGPVYTLSVVSSDIEGFVQVTLNDEIERIYFGLLPENEERRILLSTGNIVTIDVVDVEQTILHIQK